MTIVNAYNQTIDADASLAGGDYAYAVAVPLSAGGAAFRLVLRGPASGSTVVSDMWAGTLASGYNFVPGSQSPVTVGGATTFTISSGQEVTTDPILAAVSGTLLCVFDLHGGTGRAYRRKAVSGLSYGYATGQQNTANGADARSFINIPNYTALIKSVSVGALVDFDPAPDDEPAPMYPWLSAIKGDQLFSSGNVFYGVTGEHLAVGLFNPAGSGRDVYLHQIDINAEWDTVATLHSMADSAWGVVPSRCNLDFRTGAPASLAKLRAAPSITSIPVGLHAFKKLRGNVDGVLNKTPYPMAKVEAGQNGVVLVLHSPGVGATVNFHWQEIPTAQT